MSRIISANAQQLCFVPSDPGCWLPKDHPVRAFKEMIEQELELTKFDKNFVNRSKHGRPRYDPVMLLKIVLYGYMVGLNSSREIAQACVERIDFRVLSRGLMPASARSPSFVPSTLNP